jgi:hypothetical protein
LLLLESIPMLVDRPVSMVGDKMFLNCQWVTEEELSRNWRKCGVEMAGKKVAELWYQSDAEEAAVCGPPF